MRRKCHDCKKPAKSGYSRCNNCRMLNNQNQIVRKYGIPIVSIQELRIQQNNVCAICNKREAIAVDHCHITKIVRGLLCKQCNFGLGLFMDDPVILQAAVEYLKTHGEKGIINITTKEAT